MTDKKLNDNELEKVSGGTPPKLPATELSDSCFEGNTLESLSPNFPSPVISGSAVLNKSVDTIPKYKKN